VEQAPGGTPSTDPQTDLGDSDGLNVLGRRPRVVLAQLAAHGVDAWANAFVGHRAPYVAAFYVLDPFMKIMPDYGKVMLPQLTGATPWLWAIGVAGMMTIALIILERIHPQDLDAKP
jgi:hypothetical protein